MGYIAYPDADGSDFLGLQLVKARAALPRLAAVLCTSMCASSLRSCTCSSLTQQTGWPAARRPGCCVSEPHVQERRLQAHMDVHTEGPAANAMRARFAGGRTYVLRCM